MKKYILGTAIALSLTACSSGGSGSNGNILRVVNEQVKHLDAKEVSFNNNTDNGLEAKDGDSIVFKGNKGLVGNNSKFKLFDNTISQDEFLTLLEDKNSLDEVYEKSTIGIKARGKDSFGFNDGTLRDDKNSTAMVAYEGGTIVNNKTIVGGMKAATNSTIINNKNLEGSIIATNNSTIINNGTLNGDIIINNSSNGSNKGIINVNNKNDLGITVNKNSQGINDKDININNYNGTGMVAMKGSKVINNQNININANNGIGMLATGKDSVAENNGTITINGENNYAMDAINGGTIINTQSGIIKLSGTITQNSNKVNGAGVNNTIGKTEFFSDNKGNTAFGIDSNSKVINHGKVIFRGGKSY